MNEIFDAGFYNALGKWNIMVKMKQNGGRSGSRRSVAKGSSVEFSDFREYTPGDDTRRVDWNAYGRLNKLFLKLFTEEKEAGFHIMVDTSKSMDFGGKRAAALRIAGLFSYMILTNLDRLYLAMVSGPHAMAPKGMTGGYSFQKALSQLYDAAFDGKSGLTEGIIAQPLTGRGVTIVISDFFDCRNLKEALKYLAYKKQEIILLQVLDKEELHPGAEGYVNLIDSENGSQCRVMVTAAVQREYQKTLEKFKKSLKELAVSFKGEYVLLSANESPEQWIAKIGKVGIV